ncbi:MAG: ribosome biogenesis GTPase Der [Desulfovibrionaceae bacterium]
MLPIIALIGRPNVGKSTIFNRLIRKNRAITHDRPGVTRDRMYGTVHHGGRAFTVVDTGGVTLNDRGGATEGPDASRGFEAEILRQAAEAVAEACAIALIVDGRDGLLPLDEHLARFARHTGKPVLLVVNKVDGPEKADMMVADFHALGLDLLPSSSAHGYGMSELAARLREMLPPAEDDAPAEADAEAEDEDDISLVDAFDATNPDALPGPDEDDLMEGDDGEPDPDDPDSFGDAWAGPELAVEAGCDVGPGGDEEGLEENLFRSTMGHPDTDPAKGLRLAMLGRPNAGKSSMVNALAGVERMIVSEIAGTTRDSVDVTFEREGRRFTFVDTAGVRRRTKITDTVERFSVNAALKTSQRADVTVLMIDALDGLTAQDKRLITFLDSYKIPFLVALNKVDLVARQKRPALVRTFADALRYCRHVPLIATSALRGIGLDKVLEMAETIWTECDIRVPTGLLNRSAAEAVRRHQPPLVNRKRAKFYYLTQAETRPPTFIFFVNDQERVKASYQRYLETTLRKMFGLKHAPMRLHFRGSHEKKT